MKDTANSHFKMKCVHEINVFFDDLLTVLSQEAGFYSFFPLIFFSEHLLLFFFNPIQQFIKFQALKLTSWYISFCWT